MQGNLKENKVVVRIIRVLPRSRRPGKTINGSGLLVRKVDKNDDAHHVHCSFPDDGGNCRQYDDMTCTLIESRNSVDSKDVCIFHAEG